MLLGFLFALFSQIVYASEWPSLSVPLQNSVVSGSRDAALIVAVEDYFIVEDVVGASQNARDWFVWLSQSQKIPIEKIQLELLT